jgi:lysophospholipase L1-like esterase
VISRARALALWAVVVALVALVVTSRAAAFDVGLTYAPHPSTWTPANAAPVCDLDVADPAHRTLSGSTISALVCSSGIYTLAASGGAPLPALDTADTINGQPTLQTTVAGGEKLYSSSGPALGSDVSFTAYVVARLYGTDYAITYPSLLTLGSPAGTTDEAVFLGARAGQWWAGPQDASLGALGGATDTAPHLHGLEYDASSGKFTRRLDGTIVAGPTAGTFNASGSFPAGFGFSPQAPGFNGNTLASRVVLRLGVDSTSVRRQHERYFASYYGLDLPNLVAGVGDSTTYGTGSSNPPATSWLGQLPAQAALAGWSFVTYNDGHPGETTAGALVTVQSADALCSGARWTSVAVLFAGINDIAQGVSTATTTADLATLKSLLEGAGCTVLVGTLYPWDGVAPFGWDQGKADAINTWIRTNVAAARVIEWANTPEMQLVAGTYQPTYRHPDADTDAGHPTDAGYAAMARDAAPAIYANRNTMAANDNGIAWGAPALAAVVGGLVVAQRRKRRAA